MHGRISGQGNSICKSPALEEKEHRTFGKLKGGQVAESVSESVSKAGEEGRSCAGQLPTVILKEWKTTGAL